ncbi:response regulator transcription factor [Rhodopila globiformis]|uniref:Response regulatory domain-containing protein n=1 Tax=Rhodopila globiformis TaxID=1071 RepID=A0A2S6NPE2_RHOGL|nr:response regulator transcription factor [Rhodopila globiformis]PPQ40816.1 hypothetical protein CCS01_00315 [Rhodopila globiformis]
MDGLSLVEHLRASGGPPPCLLMMTGRVTAEVERRAAAAGVRVIQGKPLDPAEVLAAIGSALAE